MLFCMLTGGLPGIFLSKSNKLLVTSYSISHKVDWEIQAPVVVLTSITHWSKMTFKISYF